ncbi:hypothetical protein [Puniceicoccus vermicola]|uniref:Uncharacterized protein n=1 Tax=Puniceicoccus vermicola TaxID=388746 RepID=A0A7X1E534_9BACT|nr:hypothetical protein [Puniceicoccus vermicola]MBC2602751.1 hypothetical protein [Puniceicoccus vermicola]
MAPDTLFSRLPHPFVSSTSAERPGILQNLENPIWHQFVEESEKHFRTVGGLRPPHIGHYFCHNGDLDEVMATAMLAYIRDDRQLWFEVGDWLRALLQHYKSLKEVWAERFAQISLGKWPEDLKRGNQHPGVPTSQSERGASARVEWVPYKTIYEDC